MLVHHQQPVRRVDVARQHRVLLRVQHPDKVDLLADRPGRNAGPLAPRFRLGFISATPWTSSSMQGQISDTSRTSCRGHPARSASSLARTRSATYCRTAACRRSWQAPARRAMPPRVMSRIRHGRTRPRTKRVAPRGGLGPTLRAGLSPSPYRLAVRCGEENREGRKGRSHVDKGDSPPREGRPC